MPKKHIAQCNGVLFWEDIYRLLRRFPEDRRHRLTDWMLDYMFSETLPAEPSFEDAEAFADYERLTVTYKDRLDEAITIRRNALQNRNNKLTKGERTENGRGTKTDNLKYKYKRETSNAHPREVPTEVDFVSVGIKQSIPEEYARRLYAELDAAGWADAKGVSVGNWKRYLSTAWKGEQKKIAARATRSEGGRFVDMEGVM